MSWEESEYFFPLISFHCISIFIITEWHLALVLMFILTLTLKMTCIFLIPSISNRLKLGLSCWVWFVIWQNIELCYFFVQLWCNQSKFIWDTSCITNKILFAFREGLMSYKQFIQELEDDILPSEAERR